MSLTTNERELTAWVALRAENFAVLCLANLFVPSITPLVSYVQSANAHHRAYFSEVLPTVYQLSSFVMFSASNAADSVLITHSTQLPLFISYRCFMVF
jgi:hypothetical protein